MTNIALHLLVCIAVFVLGIRMGLDPPRAALAVLLFGLFPRSTEAVTFVSSRADLLASLAVVVALAIYCRDASSPVKGSKTPGEERALRLAKQIIAAITILLGLLCKEAALAGAAGIVAHAWAGRTPGRGGWRAFARDMTPLGCALGIYTILRLNAPMRGQGAQWSIPDSERWIFALQALGEYAGMIAAPFSPHLYVGTLGVPQMGKIAVGLLIAIGILAFFVRLAIGPLKPQIAALAATPIVALLLVIHLVPIQLRAVAADRFLYLPVAAMSLMTCGALMRMPRFTSRSLGAGLFACALLMGSATHARNAVWNDELELWRATAASMPSANGLADLEVGDVLARQGRREEAGRSYMHAFMIEREFVERYPDYMPPIGLLANAALVLSERGRIYDALPLLAHLVVVYPNSALYHLHLGSALSRALSFARADRALARTEDLDPTNPIVAQIRSQNARAAMIWNALPEPSEDESIEIRAARAEAYFQVGRLGDANTLWLQVIEAPEASQELLRQAGVIVERQREKFGETEEVRLLSEALAGRSS